MNRSFLENNGVFITERDHYNGGAYLYTETFYYYNDMLYVVEDHSNRIQYTGKSRTSPYIPCKSLKEYMADFEASIAEDFTKSEIVKMKDAMAKDNFSSIIEETGLSVSEISERFQIPYRTVQNWKLGVRECPQYVISMIKRIIDLEKHELIKKED